MVRLNKYVWVLLAGWLFGCGEEVSNREASYVLYQISSTPTRGEAIISELGDGTLEIQVQLKPIGEGSYKAHLHFGSINEVGELAYRLNDIDGETGYSTTVLDKVKLSDGRTLTYDRLMNMDGSIKVHMRGFELENAVLAYGNVGKNDNFLFQGLTVCTGH